MSTSYIIKIAAKGNGALVKLASQLGQERQRGIHILYLYRNIPWPSLENTHRSIESGGSPWADDSIDQQ